MADQIQVVVPVSGGKDSQACLKLAAGMFPRGKILGLFCDTQFEHPITYAHIDTMRDLYGVEIRRITAGSVDEKVLKYGRFPGGGARHCTEELKIVPSKKFYRELAEFQGAGFQVFYGMRSAESADREKRYAGKISDALYAPHEVMDKYPKYLARMGVMFRMPILEWTKAQVFAFLGGEHNPLYDPRGENLISFDRVGCFPCQAAGDDHKEKAYAYDEFGRSQFIRVKNLSDEIGKPMFASKGGCQRNNVDQVKLFEGSGCGFCEI